MLMDVDRFISSLFEARDYYQNIIDHALSQLEHISALLEDVGSEHSLNSPTSRLRLNINVHSLSESAQQLPQSHINNGILSDLSSTTDFEELNKNSQEAGIELNNESVAPDLESAAPDLQPKTELTSLSETSSVEQKKTPPASTPTQAINAKDEGSKKTDASTNALVESNAQEEVSQIQTQKQSKVADTNKKSSSKASRNKRLPQRPRPVNIPFVSRLEGLKLGDAILTILRENPETVSHTDYIVRAIYGDIEGNSLRIAKDRVTKELSRGYILGRWYRLPDTPGYYTVSKHLTEPRSS